MNDSFVGYLFRPYIDLTPCAGAPLHACMVGHVVARMQHPGPPVWPQRLISTHFRRSLAEAGVKTFVAVEDPRETSPRERSEGWADLCRRVDEWSTTNVVGQVHLARTLIALSFHALVARLVPPDVPAAAGEWEAQLAYARATTRFALFRDERSGNDARYELEAVASAAPAGSFARFNAALHLLVRYAGDLRLIVAAEGARERAEGATRELTHAAGSAFVENLSWSRFYRAAGLVAIATGDRARLAEQMNLAEAHAGSLPCSTPDEYLLASENRYSLLESRTKEALWLGDLDLADARARELTEVARDDSKALIELAEVHVERGKLREAAEAYRAGARVGPPGTALAWFMAGQCHESLDELELAVDCYLASLRVDPQGISALERLARLSRRLGNRAIGGWAQLRLERLDAPLTPLDGAEPVGVPIP